MPGPVPKPDSERARRNADAQFRTLERDPGAPIPALPEHLRSQLMPEAAQAAERYWNATWQNVGPLLQENPAMRLELERGALLAAQILELGVEAPASLHAQLTALGDRLGATYHATQKLRVNFSQASAAKSNLAPVVELSARDRARKARKRAD